MTDRYLANTAKRLRNPQQVGAQPWRDRWRGTRRRLALVFILASCCGLMLTGCKDFWSTTGDLLRIGGDDAEAQATRDTDRVEVFVIESSSFLIRVDNDTDSTPTHVVRDGMTTEFTMESQGTVIMNVSGVGERSEEVAVGDTIILSTNGNTSTVTFIRILLN